MISIIMPIYNARDFLQCSIGCILNQQYQDFEVVIIDDASTDDSLQIINSYKTKDSRFVVLHNVQRKGAAISRNIGLAEAKGDYVVFWDADDYFVDDLLLRIAELAEKHKPDVIQYEYVHVDSDDIGTDVVSKHSKEYINRYCERTYTVGDMDALDYEDIKISPCNKAYKRVFLLDNRIEFQDLPSSNDVYFSEMALMLSKSIISLVCDRYMLQARDHNSASRISFHRDPMCSYSALERIRDELIRRDLMKVYYDYFLCRIPAIIFSGLYKISNIEERISFFNFIKEQGLRSILSSCREYYNSINKVTRGLMERFLIDSYESFSPIKFYDIKLFFELRTDGINQIINDYHRKNNKIALWGIGKRGVLVASCFYKKGMDIDYYLDVDSNKKGETIFGKAIHSPYEIVDNYDVVLFTTKSIYDANKASKLLSDKECFYLMDLGIPM